MTPRRKRRLRRIALNLLLLYALLLIITFATHLPDQLIVSAAPGPLDSPNAHVSLLPAPTGEVEVCIADAPLTPAASPDLYVLFFVGNEDRVNPRTAGVAAMWQHDTHRSVEA
jgi:hypothetical protein